MGLLLACFLFSCKGQDTFVQQSASEFFTVDFNPDYIDVLWVVDDRSPMFNNRTRLISEASKFFARLDGIASSYRMAVISADSKYAKGRLKPDGAGVLLTKSYGTVEQRTQSFGTILSQVINLHTGAQANGLEASMQALTATFIPAPLVPLVVVYISDGDDHSEIQNSDAVDYYADALLKLKGGKKDLLRVYSINLKDLAGQPQTDANRCTTLYQAEMDVLPHNTGTQPSFEDRYFRLADKLGGEKADLCGSFSSLIKLDGLALKELPKRFKLQAQPRASSLKVNLFRGEEQLPTPAWSYDASTNEIVFVDTPPAGTTVYVSFDPTAGN